MKPLLKLFLIVAGVLCIAAVGNQYFSVLPGLQIKHPITGATTATINGTNGYISSAGTVSADLMVSTNGGTFGTATIDSSGNVTATSFTATGGGATILSNVVVLGLTTNLPLKLGYTNQLTTSIVGTDYEGGIGAYSTASLGSGSYAGQQRYCTDCLTPWGTGDRVEWDGSIWRTMRVRVPATTDMLSFIISCRTNAVTVQTPISEILMDIPIATTTGLGMLPMNNGGSGSIAIYDDVAGVGPYHALLTGASNNGSWRYYGTLFPIPSVGDYYASSGKYWSSALPDGTDNFVWWMGFNSQNTTNMPVSAALFIQDKWNMLGHNLAYTNNLICATFQTGQSPTYTDSGLPLPSPVANRAKLMVVLTSGHAYFLTNNVLCQDITTTLPDTTVYANAVAIFKGGSGTTSRSVAEVAPALFTRHTAYAY